MSSIWGNKLKISLFGQSHGECVGGVLDGLPAGLKIDMDFLALQLNRRKSKSNLITSSRIEIDEISFLSGITNGTTNGAPICLIIKNENIRPQDYEAVKDTPRPSHADYAAHIKYGGYNDFRGGGHLSGRLTAPLVALGSIAQQFLQSKGIFVAAHLYQVGDIFDMPLVQDDLNKAASILRSCSFPALDGSKREQMIQLITSAAKKGDSVGGTVECIVAEIPAGMGSPIFDNVESILSSMLFSIPGVKAVEFGSGRDFASMTGSSANDSFYFDNSTVKTHTNNSGGINGGITNGMAISLKATFRPTPSILLEQQTINLKEKRDTRISISGRHDACIAVRGVVCIETAVSIAMANMIL